MKFGHFDDLNKEYVITTPYTPFPWINYLGNENYFALFSNTSGGYSFYRDARLRRLTRFRYNNVPVDHEGRFFYIKENELFWNIGERPSGTKLDFYEARHGLGYSKITGRKNGLKAEQISFVPNHFNGEIHMITLTNESHEVKSFSLFSYVEWALWDALDDSTNFQRNYSIGEVEIEGSTIYHKTEYRERRSHYAFYHVNQRVDGFDTDREKFIGLYGSVASPEVVKAGDSKNSVADGWAPIASHHLKVTLNAYESKSIIFILGYVENEKNNKFSKKGVINKSKAHHMIQKFDTKDQVLNALDDLKMYWEKMLGNYQIHTTDEKLNRMVNIWNQYQIVTCFNVSRSASYFESGIGRGMGFRDSNQDLLGFAHMNQELTRNRILDLASTLLEDGGAYHQYSPLSKKGNADIGGGFNDDPNWLILATCAYIKESGDFSILDEVITYESNPTLLGTLLEHLDKAFYKIANNLGPNGLPLIGRADWNDCLNLNCFSEEPGESFQTVANKGDGKVAESVFIGGLFVLAGKEYARLLEQTKQFEKMKEINKHIVTMSHTMETKGYDDAWFLRAYNAYGEKIGSKDNEEGKIFIEPQGIAVMAGIGLTNGKAKKALANAKLHLDTPYGMVLNYPAYTSYHLELGEISSYPPGYKENGGIFCHNNPWIACANAVIGNGEEAFSVYKKIAPAYLEDVSEIHRTEPYVYAQMIAGKEASRHGEAKNSWLTGTAAWNFVAISQYILGIHPDYKGLRIQPVIPIDFGNYEVVRKFRETTYRIHVEHSSVHKGLYVNGQKINDTIVPYYPTKEIQNIVYYIEK